MNSKPVHVILAFHAHEPLWDLPARVLETLRDDDLRRAAVGNDNWVRRRAAAGRDVYARMLDLGGRLGAPLCLEATDELLMQLERHFPATFARIGDAYRSGALYPIYGNAFHTHIAMLTDAELADELRLNQEFVHDVLGAPRPRHPGAFPMEGSIDARKLAGFRAAGMEYVVFPNISPAKMRYAFDGLAPGTDPTYGAFTIGDGLIALPRHFPVSQEIWRPITKIDPAPLAPQGYILGKYHVFEEEYRSGRPVAFPITRAQGVAEYAGVLRQALREAPDGGLLLYIQDLELMDFGEQALDIIGEAWQTVRDEGIADVRFVTPDAYIDATRAAARPLPRMRFHQASWAPEIRLVLRSDGHYPPLHAGPFRGIDADAEIFRRWPFIFWEPGRFIADTFRALLAAFGHDLALPLTARDLDERGYDFTALAPAERLPLHLRVMQRACNFGWQPDEARHKWPYMHGLAICEILRDELSRPETSERVARDFRPLPERALRGLDGVLQVFVDTRVAYLRRGIQRLGERAGSEERRAEAERHLLGAEQRRRRASALARQLLAEDMKFITSCAINARAVARMLALLQEHCREAYLALNEAQRAWMCIDDTAAMIQEMYAYLYHLYPPKFPAILRTLLAPEEIAALDAPPLA